MTIRGGGVRRLMEKTILNFHFDYLTPTLTITLVPEKRGKGQKLQDVQAKTI